MTIKSSNRANRQKDSGFTLLEMAIVMLIVGFMSTIFYTLLFHAIKLKPSEDRIEIVKQALAEHVRVTGRFPCPADPTLAEGNVNYMREECGAPTQVAAGILQGALPIDQLMAASDCGDSADIIGAIDNQLETLSGQLHELREKTTKKDTDIAGGADRRNENRQVKDRRCITPEFFLDQYGNKLTYMVTTRATRIHDQDGVLGYDPFDNSWGQIVVRDAVGNTATTNPVIFAVISHGENGQGAYNTRGQRGIACNATAGNDTENCDDDNELRDQLRNTNLAGGAYYDDTIDFSLSGVMLEEDYWRWEIGPSNDDMVFNDNANMILNNIPPLLVGTEVSGSEKLIVNEGDIHASGNIDTSANVIAREDPATPATGNVNATVDVNAGVQVISPKYCYTTSPFGGC